jgi:hypothetical protein
MACVDATGIAKKNELGTRTHPIINTAMIGAFARMLEMPPLEAIADAIASGKQAAMALDTYFARGTDAVEQRLAGCRVGAGPALSMAVYLGKDRKNRTACCSDQCVPAVRSRRRYSLYPEFQRRSKGERIFYKPGPV